MNCQRFSSTAGCAAIVILQIAAVADAATILECQQLLNKGQYAECLTAATDAIERRSYGEEWPILKATAEINLGQYKAADATIEAGTERYSWSIRLRMLAHSNCRILGDREKAERLIVEIDKLYAAAPWRYTDADDLVALGKAAAVIGVDPKDLLEGFYERARRNYSTRPDGFIASAELALSKGDSALAADILRPVAEKFADNPDVLFLLSEALHSGASQESAELLQQTLTLNPNYLPALQRLAEQQIDAEDYTTAAATIAAVHKINPNHPETHALQAVIYHLQNQPESEVKSRETALQFSTANPAVDHLIGERLSRKYRFAEGAAYQRRALQTDPAFLPAKTQLAQDLLRLGIEDDGWKLAEEAQEQDKYSTTLFNLLQLKDTVQKFTTLTSERFVIRMERGEATVYGPQVQILLNEAFDTLTSRYNYTPDEPVVVEIFDRQDDFAVRTFGIPDVAGFLGVCFGKVITANSPASQRSSPNNWNSVLWHEFCHVITLQMTGNRIPRWLSEGISVYEERQRDKRWGQHMTPQFRQQVQAGRITPVSELSSAFLNAKSGSDLNFAYYESSMVVEFIVQEHGFEALQKILQSLNEGLTINDALDRHTGGLTELEAGFDKYLKSVADDFAKGVTFTINDPEADPDAAITIEQSGSKNYSEGLLSAVGLVKSDQLDEAEAELLQLIKLYPEDPSPQSARRMLATVYGRQQRTSEQIAVLTEHLQQSGDDLTSAIQLLALQVAAKDWPQATVAAKSVMAIDPLQPKAIRHTLTAALELKDRETAVQMLQALLELEPADAARTHFQLAQILMADNTADAKRHVLLALEQAPRYRDAHKLLLQLQHSDEAADVRE
jgi:tetratricopeptide (TPR) repeat protein